jgi:hypothetical protein
MYDKVSRSFELLLTGSDVPDPGPHVLPFTLRELAAVIAIGSDRVATYVARVFAVQNQRL